jgi:hypothetical protein
MIERKIKKTLHKNIDGKNVKTNKKIIPNNFIVGFILCKKLF